MSASTQITLVAVTLAWLALAALARWITAAPIRRGDPLGQTLYRLMQLHARLVQRARVVGLAHVPPRPDHDAAEPLIIVANHSAGTDPILIQTALPFEIRWVMAEDMRVRALDGLWEKARIIFVDRRHGEAMALREALRHLKRNGVIGLFPEGHIERPPRVLRPFQQGIAMIIARSGARVLPVVIEGTPLTDAAWISLFRAARATVRFLPPIDYASSPLQPAEIAADLQRRFAEATGWPINDHEWKFTGGDWIEQPRRQ